MSFSLVLLSFCTAEKDPSIEKWWVNGSRIYCEDASPMTCLQIQKTEKLDPEAWQIFDKGIDGFQPKSGNIYLMKVKVIPPANPIPKDAFALRYQFIDLISIYTTEDLVRTDVWEIKQVYQIKNPLDQLSKEPLLFEFDLVEKTYAGNLGCNHIQGQIISHTGPILRFGLGASTKKACTDMSVEKAVTKGLADTRTYQIQQEKMRFMDEEGKTILEFDRKK